MNVLIEKDIFNSANSNEDILELSFLLHIIHYGKRYTLLLKDDITHCTAYNKLPSYEQETLNYTLVSTCVSSLSPDCTVSSKGVSENTKKIFSLSEAIKYLMQPLSIIVENSFTDPHFIKAIIRCYRGSELFFTHLTNGWIQFENAGGCGNVKNFLNGRLEYFNNKPKFLKCFILLDGDKRYPNHKITKYDNLKQNLGTWNVDYHILEKRCMENYLPIEAIPENNNTREWLNAYKYLTPEQRDFLNIGSGFIGDANKLEKRKIELKKKRKRKFNEEQCLRKNLDKPIKLLYHSVSETNFKILSHGIELSPFKTKYPLLFDEVQKVYKKSMEKMTAHQTNHNELQDIRNKIMKLM